MLFLCAGRYLSYLNLPVCSLSNHFCFSSTPLTRSGKPPATPASVEVLDSENRLHTLQVQVLGTEETWQTPSLLLATTGSGPGAGKIVFSQARANVNSD